MVTLTLSPLYAKCLIRVLRSSPLADYHVVSEIIELLEKQL